MKNLWFLLLFQIDEDDIDDVGEMKKQESLNRYIVNALSGICNLLKKDIILHVVKVHNPEHLMGSKQSSKSELQQQNLVSSHLTLPKNFVWGGGWISFKVSVYVCGWERHSFHIPLLKFHVYMGKQVSVSTIFVMYVTKWLDFYCTGYTQIFMDTFFQVFCQRSIVMFVIEMKIP